MKNYAKFCKIKIGDKDYQLNLTEGGVDTAGWLGRSFSTIRLGAPLYCLYLIGKNLITYLTFGTILLDDISYFITSFILVAGFCLPHTNLGNAFNAITKSMILKHKTKNFYKKMRALEAIKIKSNTSNKYAKQLFLKQAKIAKKFLKYLKRQSKKYENLSFRYHEAEEKKGYLSGLKAFALENLEMHQEAIDKFLFHNMIILLKLCPDEKDFIRARSQVWYKKIFNNEPYYDEFIYSASHNENLVKNDCLYEFDESHYLDKLKKVFNLKNEDEIKSYSLSEIENKPKLQKQQETQEKNEKAKYIEFEKL